MYLTPWPLQYGATRVEVQPDGSLAYPGALTDGENGKWILSHYIVSIWIWMAIYSSFRLFIVNLLLIILLSSRLHPELDTILFCSQNEVAASPLGPDSFHRNNPGLCITPICIFLDYIHLIYSCIRQWKKRSTTPTFICPRGTLIAKVLWEEDPTSLCSFYVSQQNTGLSTANVRLFQKVWRLWLLSNVIEVIPCKLLLWFPRLLFLI